MRVIACCYDSVAPQTAPWGARKTLIASYRRGTRRRPWPGARHRSPRRASRGLIAGPLGCSRRAMLPGPPASYSAAPREKLPALPSRRTRCHAAPRIARFRATARSRAALSSPCSRPSRGLPGTDAVAWAGQAEAADIPRAARGRQSRPRAGCTCCPGLAAAHLAAARSDEGDPNGCGVSTSSTPRSPGCPRQPCTCAPSAGRIYY